MKIPLFVQSKCVLKIQKSSRCLQKNNNCPKNCRKAASKISRRVQNFVLD